MRIVLLGHEDLASLFALHLLMETRPKHDYSVLWSGQIEGTDEHSVHFDSLSSCDRQLFEQYLAGLDPRSVFRSAECLPKPNSASGLEQLRSLQPELIVSVRYRRILREHAIAIPDLGVLNLHSGLLPHYRGVMATFWAMLRGEKEIGSTLHWVVDAGIDTGPIIGTSRQPANYSMSYLENVLGLYRNGVSLITDALDTLAAGDSVASVPQTAGAGSYFGPPTESDARRFLAAGLALTPASPGLFCESLAVG